MTGLDIVAADVVHLDWNDLAAIPGRVGDVSTVASGAVGAAVPVAALLDRAGVPGTATHATVISRDGSYLASIPLETLRRGGWLAYELEGRPLAKLRGGPLRLTVAEGETLCWNVKDVATIRLTDGREPDSVPENPPH